MNLDIILALFIAIAIFLCIVVGYSKGFNQGRCEGQYGTGAIYEDGGCFNPVTK